MARTFLELVGFHIKADGASLRWRLSVSPPADSCRVVEDVGSEQVFEVLLEILEEVDERQLSLDL